MAVEYTVTVGKNGLRITGTFDAGISIAREGPVIKQRRLQDSFTASHAAHLQEDAGAPRSRAHTGGGQAKDPSKIGGGQAGDPSKIGGDGFGAGPTIIIGPIVITACPCCAHQSIEQKEE
jgi:hypothetical protein